MLSNADLKFHFHPEKGWLNDPNGLCFFGGYYHIFFQHAPGHEYPWAEPMVWGHCRTRDFLTFEELPVALRGDEPYDEKGVWSGTAVEKDGRLWIFYASVSPEGRQTVSAAWSDDGVSFVKYPGNPVIAVHPPEGSDDFRDPAVFVAPSGNYLVVASADTRRGTGNLLLYKSADFFNWEYAGVLREYPGARFCECPSLAAYGDGVVLATSVVMPDDSRFFEVAYGGFDGARFTPEKVSRFQKGPDEYAGQIFRAPDGRCLMMSWIPGWKYRPKEKCIGCLSLPLEITLEGGELRARPAAEVRHLVAADGTVTDAYVRERYADDGRAVWIELLEKP